MDIATLQEILTMKSIILFLLCSMSLPFFTQESVSDKEDELTIELIHDKELNFEVSVKHMERRKQIHIRSEKPLLTLRMSNADRKKKDYDIVGSSLVLLPVQDFTAGQEHFLEMKFQESQAVVIAKVYVPAEVEVPIN